VDLELGQVIGGQVGDPLGQGECLLFQFVSRDRVVDQVEFGRFGRANRVAGVEELLGLAHVGQQRQDRRGARAGEAQPGVTDLRVLGGDDEVGHHRELEAAGDRVAVQLGDGDLLHVPEVEPDVGHPGHAAADAHDQAVAVVVDGAEASVDGIGAVAACRGQVVAGREGTAGALDDDHADIVVGLEVLAGVAAVVNQLLRERVHLLRPVEREHADPVVGASAIEQDVLKGWEGHVGSRSGREVLPNRIRRQEAGIGDRNRLRLSRGVVARTALMRWIR